MTLILGVGDVSLCPLSGDEESDPQSGERQSDTGLLEVYTEYGWSAVSSFGFGGVEAQVACVQLGFAFVSNVTILTAVSRYIIYYYDSSALRSNYEDALPVTVCVLVLIFLSLTIIYIISSGCVSVVCIYAGQLIIVLIIIIQ